MLERHACECYKLFSRSEGAVIPEKTLNSSESVAWSDEVALATVGNDGERGTKNCEFHEKQVAGRSGQCGRIAPCMLQSDGELKPPSGLD